MQLLLSLFLSALAVNPGPAFEIRPGGVFRIEARIEDPFAHAVGDNHLTLGSLREPMLSDGGTGLYAVVFIPRFNREASPPLVLELTDQARNFARFISGRHFPALTFHSPMVIDRTPPRIEDVRWAPRTGSVLTVRFLVMDESPSTALVQVVTSLSAPAGATRQLASKSAICTKEGELQACEASLALPEQIPGEPRLIIQAIDVAGNRSIVSGEQKQGLRLIWPARPSVPADTEPVRLHLAQLLPEPGRLRATFGAYGGDGIKEVTVNGRLEIRDERRTLIQNFRIPAAVASCSAVQCQVDVPLPERLASQEFSLVIHVTGNNDQTDLIHIPTDRLDLSAMLIDNVPPRLLEVRVTPSNQVELDSYRLYKDLKQHLIRP